MSHLSGPLSFLLVLGVLVAVHEFGHFAVAKLLGVKVLKFSIGFGPRLIGFTRGETEYRVSLLPLGGYVKMAGEVPGEAVSEEDLKRSFLVQAPWKKMLIVAAGPAVNLVFPILVYFFVFLGSAQVVAPRLGSVEAGLPAAKAGLMAGDRVLSIDGKPVQSFDDIRERLKNLSDRPTQITVQRQNQQLTKTLTPVAGFNVDPVERVPQGYLGISAAPRPPVVGVLEGSAAYASGLRTFDRIVAVNGQPVRDEQALQARVAEVQGEQLNLEVLRFSPVAVPGVAAHLPSSLHVSVPHPVGGGLKAVGVDSADLYLSRVLKESPASEAGLLEGDRVIAVNGKPVESQLQLSLMLQALSEQPFQLTVRKGEREKTLPFAQRKMAARDELGNDAPVLQPGFFTGPRGDYEKPDVELTTLHRTPAQAMGASLKLVPEVIRKTVMVVLGLLTGNVAFNTVGGPIMMYQMASKAASIGVGTVLELMAVISINLGVMNLLPVPVLDGFGLVSAAWEGVRRRPIPLRAREIANLVGLAMLLVLMLAVMRNDVGRIIHGG